MVTPIWSQFVPTQFSGNIFQSVRARNIILRSLAIKTLASLSRRAEIEIRYSAARTNERMTAHSVPQKWSEATGENGTNGTGTNGINGNNGTTTSGVNGSSTSGVDMALMALIQVAWIALMAPAQVALIALAQVG